MHSDDAPRAKMPYPWLHEVADVLAAESHKRSDVVVQVQLALALLIAATSDFSSLFAQGTQVIVAVATAALVVVLLYEQVRGRRHAYEQDWFAARAIAEAVKTATWRYMMAAPPFPPHAAADSEYTDLLNSLVARARQLKSFHARAEDLTSEPLGADLRHLRGEPWQRRRDAYVQSRLEEQMTWYQRNARQNAERSRRSSQAAVGMLVIAVLVAISHALLPQANFVGTVTTLAADIIAWSQAKRFQELSISYSVAHDELEDIRARARQATSEADIAAAVLDGEAAIAREHTIWLTRSTSIIGSAPGQ